MDYKIILGTIAVIIGIIGYIPYFRDMFRGKTKPHAFSWLLWGILTMIAFAAQLFGEAGAGAWIVGISGLMCLFVASYAFAKGDRKFVKLDWICMVLAIISIVLWVITSNPSYSVILVTIADFIAFIPTFRKSYHNPHEETLFEYETSFLKYIFGIAALDTWSIITWLYPASLVLTNAAFVVMSKIRIKQLGKQ